jgi:DNA gyrase subunit A
VAVLPIASSDSVVVVSSSGMLVRTPAAEIREIGRNTQGVRVVRLKDGDAVVGVASAPKDDDAAGEASVGAPSLEAGVDAAPPASPAEPEA